MQISKKRLYLVIAASWPLALGCRPEADPPEGRMAEVSASPSRTDASAPTQAGFVGSKSCRDCHQEFYQLWSTSWHGLAMQPYTAEFAKEHLTPQAEAVKIGDRQYRAEIDKTSGWVARSARAASRNTPSPT